MQVNDIKADTSENVNKLFQLIANRILRKIDLEEKKRKSSENKLNNVSKGSKINKNSSQISNRMLFLNKPQFGCKKYKMDEENEKKVKEEQEKKAEGEKRDPTFLNQLYKKETDKFKSIDIIASKKDFLDKINEDLNFIGMEYEKNLNEFSKKTNSSLNVKSCGDLRIKKHVTFRDPFK